MFFNSLITAIFLNIEMFDNLVTSDILIQDVYVNFLQKWDQMYGGQFIREGLDLQFSAYSFVLKFWKF